MGKTLQNYLQKTIRFFADENYRFMILSQKGIYNSLSDEEYLTRLYKALTGKTLNLSNPKTFNEKMQWLKVYDRKPIYTAMADKVEVKKIVAKKIGNGHVVPTFGVYDTFEEIPMSDLPNQFVMKCTHNSGGIVICRDKKKFDAEKAGKTFSRMLKQNYYWSGREWPYKDIKPRILVEEYLQSGDKKNLDVYKIFNFQGEPYLIQTIQNDKTNSETIDYFDTKWNQLDLRQNFPNSTSPLAKPDTLDTMLKYAKMLSKGFPFLRTDFYSVNGEVFFSEFTFYSDSGFERFYPDDWDIKLGEMIPLTLK